METHKTKFERDIALHHPNITDAEYQKLLAKHKSEMAALERNLDEERDRQNNVLKEKVRRNDEEYF